MRARRTLGISVLVVAFGLSGLFLVRPATAVAEATGDEVVLVEPSGRWHIRVPGEADYTFFYGNPGDIPLLGDWDGDGLDTPGMWRQIGGGGYAYLTNSLPPNGGFLFADFDFYFGNPGDEVFSGDWDGDGIDTLGINRRGHIFLTDTNGTGGAAVPTDYDFWFGTPGDRAFGGDADSSGGDSVFLYRATDGYVYYTNETPVGPGAVASTETYFFFGIASDKFVSGDWDGDGGDTAGVFRGSNTVVYLSNDNAVGGSAAPTHESQVWGSAGWTPVAGHTGISTQSTTPTSTVLPPTTTVTTTVPVPGTVDLATAVGAGLVEARFRATGGASGDVVELQVRRLDSEDIEITVPPGLELLNPVPGQQDLVLSTLKGELAGPGSYSPRDTIELLDDLWHDYLIEAFCTDAHQDNPSDGNDLALGEEHSPDLTSVLVASHALNESILVTQATVWAVTDDVTTGELATIGYGLTGDQLARARTVIETASLDASDYRLFD